MANLRVQLLRLFATLHEDPRRVFVTTWVSPTGQEDMAQKIDLGTTAFFGTPSVAIELELLLSDLKDAARRIYACEQVRLK